MPATRDVSSTGRERIGAIFDVELTNCCNARCVMCPRERTPAMGYMDDRTFDKVVERAVEYGRIDDFVLCGLGEPLLHKGVVGFVRRARQAGLKPSIITNGSRLSRDLSEQLVEAGLRNINLSLGGYRKDTYEAIHRGLRFDEVYRNGLDFLEVAKGKATLNLQISPTVESVKEASEMAAFWRAHGAKLCFIFPFAASRGGALPKDEGAASHCEFRRLPEIPKGCINIEELFRPSARDGRLMRSRTPFVCYTKDRVTFISWQGNYHLCCSDYEKEQSIGSVLDMSVSEAYARKAGCTRSTNALCAHCDFSGGDPPARDISFYLRMGTYLFGSAVLRLGPSVRHPDLALQAVGQTAGQEK